jgi:hypothetical protein
MNPAALLRRVWRQPAVSKQSVKNKYQTRADEMEAELVPVIGDPPYMSMTLARGVKAHSYSGSVSSAALPTIRPGRRSVHVWGVYPVRRILADYTDTRTEKK